MYACNNLECKFRNRCITASWYNSNKSFITGNKKFKPTYNKIGDNLIKIECDGWSAIPLFELLIKH